MATRLARRRLTEITLPAGTRLQVVLDTGVGSDTSRVEEPVRAHLTRPVVVRGVTVLPSGSSLGGVVTDATRSGRVKGLAHVAMRFDSLTPHGNGERYQIHSASVGRTAPATKKKDALEIGAPAAAAPSSARWSAARRARSLAGQPAARPGTVGVLATRGKEIHVPRGSALTIRLSAPLTVRVAD